MGEIVGAKGKIVSCTKIPDENKYVAFTSDFRTIVLDRFVRTRVPPPKPPERLCKYPDVFADMVSPERFARAVGVPCRVGYPCTLFSYDEESDEEVVEECRDGYRCWDLYTRLDKPENLDVVFAWEFVVDLMNYPKHHSTFGQKVYRQVVFIGKRRAYVAPWSPTQPIYLTMKALIHLGILEKEFEYEILDKHEVFTIHDLVSKEKLGKIEYVAYNFYEKDTSEGKKYDAIAVFWTASDKIARRYALRVWDLHKNFTMKIAKIVESLGDNMRTYVEEYIKLATIGTTHAPEYWHTRGITIDALLKYIPKDLTRGARTKVEDPSPKLSFIMDALLGLYNPEEAEENEEE